MGACEPARPGDVFTPWHALLYSGAVALFGWQLLTRPTGRAGARERRWLLAGVGLFTGGGAGDLVWHELFGVETGLDALLSPPICCC